ncbi:hypothetical protein LTR10_019717 [Elasticomyces elasticus]|uniref:Uncharacterized protein n=1 Tax=Exophiala sideris TaxID=1016849 RepID=A0ABR0JKU1_9EURO|nr:hypothetical protein LTR10_019717 [Elasticomyces elasticus]KAK5032137.1 hypothetical protein LTR13_007354 [Exophiala sideris]KAK5036135.1 hypothetical protein LTS07_001860 [Exophiala sideris]KAK5066518.1 hypothetical protein LTR69_001864 [Exophiala sideris]KAK5180340.1 hypothetical protein LTR44_007097 [Eurotiomycetes sp. CCFEE 6388]
MDFLRRSIPSTIASGAGTPPTPIEVTSTKDTSKMAGGFATFSRSTSLSSHLPEALQPASLRDRLGTLFLRLFLPSTWAFRNRFNRRDSVISAEGELFDVESGEAMVGFDVQERGRRRDGMERQVSDMDAAARTANQAVDTVIDSNRRLSRELEEGFRDDSEEEGEDNQVGAGRRSASARR